MKYNEFTECPIYEGKLEQRTLLDHPKKGVIPDVTHHVCLQCGEIFLSGEAFNIVHFYKHKQKILNSLRGKKRNKE